MRWDGLYEKRWNLLEWWEGVMCARHRKGTEHIALTVNIMWAIWKERNSCQFNNDRGPLMVTVQIAWTERGEFDRLVIKT